MVASSQTNIKDELGLSLDDVELFTSLRYDALLEDGDHEATPPTSGVVGDNKPSSTFAINSSPFYMLDHHLTRVLEAASFLQWPAVKAAIPDTSTMETLLVQDITSRGIARTPAKIRFAITQQANITIDYMSLPSIPLSSLFPISLSPIPSPAPSTKVFLDTQPTPTGPATTFKTNKRSMYDSARARFAHVLPPGLGGEILIVDVEGEVLEGTLTSVYFLRGGRWVTPPVVAGPRVWRGQMGTTRRWALEKGLCVEEAVRRESVVDGEEVWLSNGARGFWMGRMEGVGM